MINIWISLLLSLATFVSFRVNIDVGYINRVFNGVNFAVYYQSVEWGVVDGGIAYSFNRAMFKETITSYYTEKLEGRVEEFILTYVYKNSDDSISTEQHCSKIIINLKTKIYNIIDFDKTMSVEMKGDYNA